jgi:hypothetical protein
MTTPGRTPWPAIGLIALLVVAAVGTSLWYSLIRPCNVNAVEEAATILGSQLDRYEDVYQVAISATPDSVVLPVSVLKQTVMDTQQMPVPGCMQSAKNELVEYMKIVIKAFDAYAAREPDSTVRGLIIEAVTHLNQFDAELKAVNECAPFCWP